MSSSLGPSFRARKKDTPSLLYPDEILQWEEKSFEINDEPVEIPDWSQNRFLNILVNADGMIDDLKFGKEPASS